jgi:rhamnosyltransferase
MRIAALVTSYHDALATTQCVKSLLSQTTALSAILVVDNSSEKSVYPEDFGGNGAEEPRVEVAHFPENLGVAGAIRFGFFWAQRLGFTHLWTFDQDSTAQEDALEQLKEVIRNTEVGHLGLYASLPFDEGQRRFLYGYTFSSFKFEEIVRQELNDSYLCDGVITSGMLVPISDQFVASLPPAALLIDGVDHAICRWFLRKGHRVLVASKSLIFHNMGSPAQGHALLGSNVRIVHNYSPFRKYYISRNHSYLELRSHHRFVLAAFFWRLRVAFYMLRESFYERPSWLWASVCSIVFGTLFGICGILVPYQNLPRFVRKQYKTHDNE